MSNDYLYSDITKVIICCAFEVYNELKPGFSERVYQRALCSELRNKGIYCQKEVCMNYEYKGKILGHNRIDILVERKVIVETKVGRYITTKHIGQVLNYLNSSEYKVGLILLFGPKKLVVKRIIHDKIKG